MKILINDLMQFSDIPDEYKSPSLADRIPNTGELIVNFTIPSQYSTFDIIDGVLSQPYFDGIDGILSQPFYDGIDGVLSQPISILGSNEMDCIGLGGTDATQVIINGDIFINSPYPTGFKDGLYDIGQIVKANTITIDHNGSYMGRIAVGQCHDMPASPTREAGFYTNIKPRDTLSGQVIASAGGFGGWTQGIDFRYKIDREIYEDFQRAYTSQIMKSFPFFLDFNNDDWFPIKESYGKTNNNLIFQSSVNFFKVSKRFEFRQAF
jgi:hypothetical protein